MKQFEFFPHTADMKFRAYGKNLEEQFKNAALALTSIMFDPQKVEKKIEKTISIDGHDGKALLVNFLEELIFLLDSEYFILHSVKAIKIEKNDQLHLTATFVGDNEEGKYAIESGVKAATYQEMEITDEYVQVVVDI